MSWGRRPDVVVKVNADILAPFEAVEKRKGEVEEALALLPRDNVTMAALVLMVRDLHEQRSAPKVAAYGRSH